METIFSREQLARQARRDALDAAAGHRVYCPYPPHSLAAQVWTVAFQRHLAEAQALEGTEAGA